MGLEKPSATDLAIYGSGGMGQEILDLASSLGGVWNVLGFIDDAPESAGTEVLATRVHGGKEWLAGQGVAVALGIGAPAARRRAWSGLESSGVGRNYPAFVHRTAHVGIGCSVGQGSVICAGAILTADVAVGRFVVVNTGATVSHNSRIGDFVSIAPGAHLAGNTLVGEGADIGIGASVIQGLSIGAWSVVGAGAVVIEDVEANTTVVGCPARRIASRPAGWHE